MPTAPCGARLVPLNCSGAGNNQVARLRAAPFLVSFWETIEPKHTTMWLRVVHHCKVSPDFTLSLGELVEDLTMQRLIHLVGAASLVILAAAPAYAQGAPQTVTLMKVDPQSLATGYRTSKVVGSTVVNESNETVGTIDDLIVTPGGQAPYAVLSVGGFLGMGTKYVVVPFTALKIVDKKMVLPGGSKEALKALPDFKYNS
jgi:hypothetical protein